jgi:homoserine/homoserine lactone efflux protein
MLLSTWLIYASVAVVTIASPGPAMLLAISNSVQYGMKTVVISSFGNIIGLFCVSAIAMAGVGALLKASASMFFILKLCGAAYLFYLGLKQWRSRKSIFVQLDTGERTTGRGRSQIFAQAILLALTNPKSILFFSALFPQFLSPGKALLPQFLILTCTFMAISFSSLMAYGFSARFVKKWMLVRRRYIWFNKIFGSIFMFFGMGMLAMRNTAK